MINIYRFQESSDWREKCVHWKENRKFGWLFSFLPGDPILHGHFGHDITSRNVSKWGRLAEHKASASASLGTQAQEKKGSLITIGADGRGGKIKVLRAHDQSLVS